MSRRSALAAALSVLATLAGAPAASAQGPVIHALDGTQPEDFRWSPKEVTVKAGETVTWSFTGTTAPHNVASTGSNWIPTFRNGDAAFTPPPASYTFSTPGIYRFVCEIHASTMDGTVIVTDASGVPPPPPPPPPLREQPWANDQQAPLVLDVADEKRPRLSRVRALAVRNGARVRFSLSERARVSVRFKLAGVTVRSAHKTFGAGTRSLTVRDRRMHGRYSIEIRATDLGGNRSRPQRVRLTVP